MTLVASIEILAGLTLNIDKFDTWLALILMSVSVNALLFHVILDSDNSIEVIVLLVLNVVVLIGYKNKYKDALN